jgi:hypothetical protein
MSKSGRGLGKDWVHAYNLSRRVVVVEFSNMENWLIITCELPRQYLNRNGASWAGGFLALESRHKFQDD